MGIDFQFLAYRGVAVADDILARAVTQHAPFVPLYRHARAPLAGNEAFHCVALYEGADDEDLPASVASPGEEEDTDFGSVAVLARELSRIVGEAFWVLQADHAALGGFASFANGELVLPASEDEAYVEGEGYDDLPAKRWLAATGTAARPDEVFHLAFPETDQPPLRLATDLERRVPFAPEEHEISLD